MPKDRYRLYHVEKAKGGIALTMTAGSAIVSRDSPPAFGNLHRLQGRDRAVAAPSSPTTATSTAAAVMIQLTHLGRRTGWNKADWLPVLSPSPVREPAHRAFPKAIEDWDIERIVADYAVGRPAHAGGRPRRHRVRGLRPSDGPVLVARHQPSRRRVRRLARQPPALHRPGARRRARSGRREFIVGIRMVADEDWEKGLSRDGGRRDRAAAGRIPARSISSTSSAAQSRPMRR